MEFTQLVKERRSARNYHPERTITKEEIDSIFELVKFSPSAFNLQHANYMIVTNPKMKEKLSEAAYGQVKVRTASAVVVVLGDKKAYLKAPQINEGLLMLGVLSQMEYDAAVKQTIFLYEKRGEEFQRDEAIRNASLSAMLFMLAAKEKGWDTCPMIGFEPERVRALLNIPEHFEIVMLITLGKEKLAAGNRGGTESPLPSL